jgi:hypothetical protein
LLNNSWWKKCSKSDKIKRNRKSEHEKVMKKNEIDIERIKNCIESDLTTKEAQKEIYSLIESLCGIIIAQSEEIQELKDEINRLKGEKCKPVFKPGKKEAGSKKDGGLDVKPEKKWSKGSKLDKINIDRVEVVKLDKEGLPEDLEFKGYDEKTIQNIILKTDNVLYRMERYYSPSTGMTYTAKLDESLQGTGYGAETKALISTLYYENRVTENKIASFLNSNGLYISEGTISNILIKEESEKLGEIKQSLFEAGISSSTYQQIDDTGMKIAGKNGYATIVCNEKYTAFFINSNKSRETVETFLTAVLVGLFIVLVGDDAPQFKKIALRFMLCWIHEERHYKKLNPVLECHKAELKRVRSLIWEYYKKLQDYKKEPTEQKKDALWVDFDEIFSQKTGYDDLDKRLALTFAKKHELLTVLDYPEVPLHNNLSENGIREMVIKRKISGGIETDEGVKAWENNMSILATCKKLGVSFYNFMKDVFSKNVTISLPNLICQK